MAVCAIIGVITEKLAYKPLRYKPRLSALITALGVSLFLENFCALPFVFGPEFRHFQVKVIASPCPKIGYFVI